DHAVAQRAETVGRFDGLADAVLVGHVGADESRAAAELVRQRLALVLREIGDDDAESFGMQSAHRRLTETARTAADDGRRALKCCCCHGFSFVGIALIYRPGRSPITQSQNASESGAASAIRPRRRAYSAVQPNSVLQLRARSVASHNGCSAVVPIAPCS